MTKLEKQRVQIGDIETQAIFGGEGESTTLFLQSNVPGVTPYCSGIHVWGKALELFAQDRRAVALELPGCGGCDPLESVPTIDVMASHVVAYIKSSGLEQVHLVGHDVAGLVAMLVAMEHPDLLSSISIVSSAWASPSGDGVENFALRYPPEPLWTRKSQQWAFDRLSYSHHHIDDALLDASVAAAELGAHKAAVAAMQGNGFARSFMASVTKTKFRFYQLAREAGIAVPVQIIAGQNDPLLTTDYPLSLFRIVGQKQRNAQFHIINRAGSFPFRDQPEEFHRLICSFEDGLLKQAQREAAEH